MNYGFVKKYACLLVALALIAITFGAYWQTFHHDFIGYDDEQYITGNPHVQAGLTKAAIVWAFTTNHASNWHPLTWISHMLDYQLFGLNPVGPHAVNLLLHIANALLLMFVLRRMTKSLWKSAFVAALFAIHPMHVESVAWVAERKDVLSTLFWLLTIWAYVRYTECPQTRRYLPIVIFFGLGLLAKPTLVTLPVVLLLMDYWPLRRFVAGNDSKSGSSAVRLVVEKLPLFAMTIGSSAATYWAQKSGGAMVAVNDYMTCGMRIANAAVTYVTYIVRMFYPHKMAIFYPHPGRSIPEWQVAGSLLLLVCVTALVLRHGRRHPYLPVGWLWYLGTLIPMIGLLQVGEAAMADRYTYISYIGLFVMIAWGVPESMRRSHTPKRPYSHTLLLTAAVAAVIVLSVCTTVQLRYWKNELTVFQHALDVTARNDIAQIHVGNCLFKQGKTNEAMVYYYEALKIDPLSDKAHNNLGNAFARLGKVDAAVNEYRTALSLRPTNAVAHFNLAVLFGNHKRLDEAVDEYKEALRIKPDYPDAHTNLAIILEKQGKVDEAMEHCAEASRLLPNAADGRNRLGFLLAKQGNLDDAIRQYTEAIRINPDFAIAHYNLGNALARKARLDESIRQYTEAIRIRPRYADAHFNLGVALDSKGDMPQAMNEYRSAIAAKSGYGEAHANLAIDLYISGKYRESWQEVILARKYGCKPNPDFLKALSSKLPEPK